MEEKKNNENIKKIIKPKLTEEDLEDLSAEEALERSYYEDSIIIKFTTDTLFVSNIHYVNSKYQKCF